MAKKEERDCSYEEMTKTVGGQSMEPDYHEDIEVNQYENTRKSGQNWNWSGTRGK